MAVLPYINASISPLLAIQILLLQSLLLQRNKPEQNSPSTWD